MCSGPLIRQELGSGLVHYHNAVKLSLSPFPFAYAQTCDGSLCRCVSVGSGCLMEGCRALGLGGVVNSVVSTAATPVCLVMFGIAECCDRLARDMAASKHTLRLIHESIARHSPPRMVVRLGCTGPQGDDMENT